MSAPLLGSKEKAELETLILAKLQEAYERLGGTALIAPGFRVAVTGSGIEIGAGVVANELASVELRTLFTALCYLQGEESARAMPRDALSALATEATSATATQINKLGK